MKGDRNSNGCDSEEPCFEDSETDDFSSYIPSDEEVDIDSRKATAARSSSDVPAGAAHLEVRMNRKTKIGRRAALFHYARKTHQIMCKEAASRSAGAAKSSSLLSGASPGWDEDFVLQEIEKMEKQWREDQKTDLFAKVHSLSNSKNTGVGRRALLAGKKASDKFSKTKAEVYDALRRNPHDPVNRRVAAEKLRTGAMEKNRATATVWVYKMLEEACGKAYMEHMNYHMPMNNNKITHERKNTATNGGVQVSVTSSGNKRALGQEEAPPCVPAVIGIEDQERLFKRAAEVGCEDEFLEEKNQTAMRADEPMIHSSKYQQCKAFLYQAKRAALIYARKFLPVMNNVLAEYAYATGHNALSASKEEWYAEFWKDIPLYQETFTVTKKLQREQIQLDLRFQKLVKQFDEDKAVGPEEAAAGFGVNSRTASRTSAGRKSIFSATLSNLTNLKKQSELRADLQVKVQEFAASKEMQLEKSRIRKMNERGKIKPLSPTEIEEQYVDLHTSGIVNVLENERVELVKQLATQKVPAPSEDHDMIITGSSTAAATVTGSAPTSAFVALSPEEYIRNQISWITARLDRCGKACREEIETKRFSERGQVISGKKCWQQQEADMLFGAIELIEPPNIADLEP